MWTTIARKLMQWGCCLGVAAAFVASAPAQVSVFIGIAPPPIRIEAPPPPPGPEVIWIGGFWAPHGPRYAWVPGHNERPPYEGAAWSSPRYVRTAQGWRYNEGRWDHGDRDHGHGHAYGHYKHDGDHHGDGDHGDEHGSDKHHGDHD